MFSVYVIRSLKRKYTYIGLTSNLAQRLKKHNSGHEKTTAPYAPFELILLESYPTRSEARKREKFLKTGIGRTSIRKVILEK
jgi:putative endonuclease